MTLKKAVAPDHPEKYVSYAAAIDLIAGLVVVTAIAGVLTTSYGCATWSAMTGVTVRLKLIADITLGWHAHIHLPPMGKQSGHSLRHPVGSGCLKGGYEKSAFK